MHVHPTWTGADITGIEVEIAGRVTQYAPGVEGTVKITAVASDRNGVSRVELLLNGRLVAKDAKAGCAFSFNAKKYGKKIKMQLRAYDRVGNLAYTSVRTYRR